MIEVVVSGARGRLGSKIARFVEEASDLRLCARLVRPGSEDETTTTSSLDALRAGVVLIEAATKDAAERHAAVAAERGAPILMATTGLEKSTLASIEAHASRCPVLIAPNLSLAIAVLDDLVRRASSALSGYDVEVLEAHHRKKRDAPSGTAWALARSAAEGRGGDIDRDAILARAGETGPRGTREIGIQAIRGGDIVGEHTVYLVGDSDRLELTHRAQDRDVFARGAVVAARFLGASDRAPGLYTMRDVLGLAP